MTRSTAFGRQALTAATLDSRSKHHVSPERLALIAEQIPRVAIIHGTEDNLIRVQRAHELHKDLPVRHALLPIS